VSCGSASSVFGELLTNPGFDVPGAGLAPPNYFASFTGVNGSAPASADGWRLWNKTAGTTTSELLTSTDPPAAAT
jgi:hypothetical protein